MKNTKTDNKKKKLAKINAGVVLVIVVMVDDCVGC